MDRSFTISGKHLIAGQRSAEGTEHFFSVNPRSGDRSSTSFVNATAQEIDRAVKSAGDAWQETRNWKTGRIADFLDAVASELGLLGEAFYQITDQETALGLPRLQNEMARTTGQLRKFAALLREGSYVQAIIDRSDAYDIRRMLIPIGPVAVFAASNFPYAFSVAGGDTASAWAAGCPVIVKAHPGHPATSELIAETINRVIEAQAVPPGFFSLIQGANTETGAGLVQHPGITAVGFTGSLQGGRALYNLAAARPNPIPVYAEMGSVNPLVILPGALAARFDALASGLFESLMLGTGQFCTNPGLVFVPASDEGHRFIQVIVEKLQFAAPGALLNPQIQSGLARTVSETLQDGVAQKLVGGSIIEGAACSFEPTAFIATSTQFRDLEALQREHFGPVVLFITYQDTDDLIKTVQHLHGQLTATIHAAQAEMEIAQAVFDQLKQIAGRLIWNGFPTGVAVVAAMQHGGPYPATTAPTATSVGMIAIERFLRPIAFQSMPDSLLPDALKNANPLGILRKVNDQYTRDPINHSR